MKKNSIKKHKKAKPHGDRTCACGEFETSQRAWSCDLQNDVRDGVRGGWAGVALAGI